MGSLPSKCLDFLAFLYAKIFCMVGYILGAFLQGRDGKEWDIYSVTQVHVLNPENEFRKLGDEFGIVSPRTRIRKRLETQNGSFPRNMEAMGKFPSSYS